MATEKRNLAATFTASGVSWTDDANAYVEDDAYAYTGDLDAAGNYGRCPFEDITEIPISITDFKIRWHDSNADHVDDTLELQVYDNHTASWSTLETFNSGNIIHTSLATDDFTTELQALFAAATDKTAFLNNLEIQLIVTAQSGGKDDPRFAPAWCNFTYTIGAAPIIRTIDDGVGVTDAKTESKVVIRGINDPLGIVDLMDWSPKAYIEQINDELGITDVMTGPANDFSTDPNCVAVWNLEDGALTADSEGANTLTNSGVASDTSNYREGKASGLFVEADQDYMVIADADQDTGFPLKNGESNLAFSFTFWLRLTALDSTQILLRKQESATERSMVIYVDNFNKLRLGISDNRTSTTYYAHQSALAADTWYHVGITLASNAPYKHRLHIWDDTAGANLGTDLAGDSIVPIIDNYPFNITIADVGSGFGGNLDEVVVFNDVLSPDEIDAIRKKVFPLSSVNDYIRTVNDSLGVIDVSATLKTIIVSFDESMGVADDKVRLATAIRSVAEALGIADETIHLVGYPRIINDTLGLTDSRSQLVAYVRGESDTVGITDSITKLFDIYRTLAESLGITDEMIGALGGIVRTINDGIGLTDDQTQLFAIIKSVADSMGLTDDASRLLVMLRIVSDSQGITDGNVLQQSKVIAESLGLTDSFSKVIGYVRSENNDLGMTDSVVKLFALIQTVSDSIGLTDSFSKVWIVLRTIDNAMGITDVMEYEGVGAVVKIINDVLGLTDSRTKLHIALRTLVESIGVTDSISKLFAVSRIISDAEGITDGVTLGQLLTVTDTIGITDSVNKLVNYLRTQNDDIGVLDAILKVTVMLRTVDDSMGLTDEMIEQLGGLVKAAWAFIIIRQTNN